MSTDIPAIPQLRWDTLSHEQQRVLKIVGRHIGRERAIPVNQVAALAQLPRRTTERVVSELVRDRGIPIASASTRPAGWYIVQTDAERQAEHNRLKHRGTEILKRARAFDPAKNQRILEMFQGQESFDFEQVDPEVNRVVRSKCSPDGQYGLPLGRAK